MESHIRVKLVTKPVTNVKYHLATFNSRISHDSSIPNHILEEFR